MHVLGCVLAVVCMLGAGDISAAVEVVPQSEPTEVLGSVASTVEKYLCRIANYTRYRVMVKVYLESTDQKPHFEDVHVKQNAQEELVTNMKPKNVVLYRCKGDPCEADKAEWISEQASAACPAGTYRHFEITEKPNPADPWGDWEWQHPPLIELLDFGCTKVSA